MKIRLIAFVVLQMSCSMAAYVDFIGQDGVPTVGALDTATNWPGGVLPSGSVTGRIAQANNVWAGIVQDLSVRLESGRIHAISSGLHQRGNTVLEIDTADWSSVTNLDISGKILTLWSQNGGTNVLSVLHGRVNAGELNMVSPGKGVLNMGSGLLSVDYWGACKGAVNMLAGGAGAIEVATVNSNADFLSDCSFNFESGNAGSITLGEIEGGTSAVGLWESLIASGNVSIDGVPTTDPASFSIINSTSSSTIRLAGSGVVDLWMPSIFSSGMVLQGGCPVSVWGEAEPDSLVSVSFAGQEKAAVVAADGCWNVTLDALAVSTNGAVLSVTSETAQQTMTFTNVLVGEVWLLSGQSNMGWTLADSTGGADAVAAADYPWLRVFSQWPYQGEADEPARDVTGGQWFTCTPDNAGTISGVGFFFARALKDALSEGTPIALINTQMGSTYAECWIDFQTLENTPSAAPFLEKAAAEVVPGGSDPDGFWGEENFRRPSALYNGKVAPLQSFDIRGVIWYQGEANSKDWLAPGYAETLTALVTSWRQQWNHADLPFLIVQLPRYDAGVGNDWPAVRAAQEQAALGLDGVELAVTIDQGEEDQIHPANKQPVGERLALLARAKVYGETVECTGPFFQSAEISGSNVLVRWTSSSDLVAGNGTVQGFDIIRSDGKGAPAQAEIMPDGRVQVYSPEVSAPFGVRYGWFNWGDVNLYDTLGLPAAPFSWQSDLSTEWTFLKEDNTGNLYNAANWIGDELPTTANGLVGWVDGSELPAGGTFQMSAIVYDLVLMQTGGECVLSGDLAIRGGATNETVTVPGASSWTINDVVNDPQICTNLFVPGDMVIWSHHGGSIEMSLLSGRIEVGGAFRLVAPDQGVVNIKDGIFRSQFFRSYGGVVNLLAGGTADVNLGQLETTERNVVFNFESGFKGSVTISKTETGAAFGLSDWQALADAGKLTVDGVSVGLEYFVLSDDGSTLQHIGTLPGLTVVDGTLYKDGISYRGIGVNYCDLFQAMINFPEYAGQTEYRTLDGLQFLGGQGIPFVRFWACGFWPSDWDLYFEDKEEWFSRMDLLVQTAEDADVGLIPSLFWRMSTYPELMGEYRDRLADPDSDTWLFMSNYVHEVVDRYKDSPAIWGWEFGNEFNNMCDLPNWTNGFVEIPSLGVTGPATEIDERNRFTYAIAEEAFGIFAQEVRKLDTHRFICNGNSKPRSSAWHNRMETNWVVDTYSQAKEALSWMAPPSSIDMASFHVYPYSMEDSSGNIEYAETSGLSNVLLRYREFCDDQNQAMFVGEYSSFYDSQGAAPENERTEETALLEAIVASGADLAAYWVFDRGLPWVRTEVGTIRQTNDYLGVLDLIREYDAKMRGETWLTSRGVPPEWFERFGLGPTDWQTWTEIEEQDLNGNGLPLWQDYLAGFQPLETEAAFAVTDFQWLENSVPRLSWQGGTNGLMTPYVIQSSTNLLDSASWETVGTKAREQGLNTWTGTSTDEPSRFYRVLAVPQD